MSIDSDLFINHGNSAKHTPHRIQAFRQICAKIHIPWIQAVDDAAKTVQVSGGMDIFTIAEVKRHMAGKIQKIRGLYLGAGDFPYGIAWFDGGIPVDENSAHKIAHKGKTGAVNAFMGLAAPAVLGAKIGKRVVDNMGTQLCLGAVRRFRRCQSDCRHISSGMIRQLDFLPALLFASAGNYGTSHIKRGGNRGLYLRGRKYIRQALGK